MQVQREKVAIDTPGGPMPAQLARPATGGPFPYRAEAAADFWQRLTAFFAEHLQG